MARNEQLKKGDSLTLADFHGRMVATDERRREPRIGCDKQIAILPCMSEKDWAFKSVGLLDCSPHGLSLLSEEAMQPEDQFLAKLRLEKMTLVLYTVRHCTATAQGLFRIGAEFSGIISGPDDGGPEAVLSALINAAE
jgi:hypothetical protein